MPELPEVETVRRGLAPVMEGRRIARARVNRPDLRFPLPERFAKRLSGARIEHLGRRAKYLLARLDTGETLLMHLGMSGRFTITPAEAPQRDAVADAAFAHARAADPRHDHVVFEMEDGAVVTFNDPRRFGYMDLIPTDGLEASRWMAAIGPEPLSNAFSGPYLTEALTGRLTPIKAALLDQKIVAGLGNIYVCEALHRARISPKRTATAVAGVGAERLVPAIKDVLTEAIAAGGSSLKDYARTDGALGYFQHSFAVYGRETQPCPACGADIVRLVQAGRSSFYCPSCQR